MAAPNDGRFVQGADVEIYIKQWGPQSGRPILLVHPAGGWSQVWEHTATRLAATGFRVIAVDMPPLGYSERPQNATYGREDQARRLIGVLDSLGISKAIMLGHSFGGRAVAEAALRNPDRLSGLILVAAALALDAKPPEPNTINSLLAIGAVRRAIAAMTLANPLFTGFLIRGFVADKASVTPYWIDIYRQPLDLKGSYAAIGDWLSELLIEPAGTLSGQSANYAKVAVPALILWGDKDDITPLEGGRKIAASIPGAKLVVLPNVGHLPPIEDEQGFISAVLDFLKSDGDRKN